MSQLKMYSKLPQTVPTRHVRSSLLRPPEACPRAMSISPPNAIFQKAGRYDIGGRWTVA